MEVLSIEAGHNKDLLALRRLMHANLEATLVEQIDECDPPTSTSILDHRRFATQQPPFVDKDKIQDLPIDSKPVKETMGSTHFPLERMGVTQEFNDSCNFDEALFPTPIPTVATTGTIAESRKRPRHGNSKRVTGAGENVEENGERNGSSSDSTDDDNEGEYQDIVDFFHARLLYKRPLVKSASRRPSRSRQKPTTC